jgi:hypothetical protein
MTEAHQGRRLHEVLRERRMGPSRLSRWTGHQVAMAAMAWVGCIIALLALGTVLSARENHGLVEARIAFSRSSITGLIAVLFVPPAGLSMQWWLMRERRRGRLMDRRS